MDKTLDMLQKHRERLKKTGCSIMCVDWTNIKGQSICKILVNSPEGTIFLYSLDISEISKTAEKIFEVLDEVVEKVGEENVVQVVTDHTTNYELAGKMLMEKRKKIKDCFGVLLLPPIAWK